MTGHEAQDLIEEAHVIAFIVLVTCAISSVLWWMEHGEDDERDDPDLAAGSSS